MSTKQTFKIVDGPVRIRRTPNGESIKRMLYRGNQIEVDADSRTEVDGFVWWQHSTGWSAERSTSGTPVFMEAVGQATDHPPENTGNGSTADTTDATDTTQTDKKFRITDGPMNVRQSADGVLVPKRLEDGTEVTVFAESRTEAGGYVWWQHSAGWSAERSIDGNEVFMTAITTTQETNETNETNEINGNEPSVDIDDNADASNNNQNVTDEHDKDADSNTDDGNTAAETDIVEWQVYSSDGLNVRDIAGTGTFAKKTLPFGTLLRVDLNSAFEKDGYFWVKHDQGWSAWKNADGSTVFMGEVTTNIGSSSDGTLDISDLTPEALPGYQTLIEEFPVALDDTQWFQYFGNNTFAYINGKAFNYDGYSQGLHGGLDFGNSTPTGIKIRAGLNGSVMRIDRAKPRNWKVWIKSGDYTIIYQHITNISALTAGQPVTPSTILAEIEPGMNHLHFEVRYDNQKYIVNPLLLMSETMVNSLIDQFDPSAAYTGQLGPCDSQLYYFYQDTNWSQWITPLDQPFIVRGKRDVIGPRGLS